MPITFNCSCGERLEVDDELAGKQARCPYCEAVVSVPAAAPPLQAKRAKRVAPDETDDDRGAYAGSLNPDDRSNRRSPRRRDDDEDDRPRPRSAYEPDDDEDEDYRPRRRRHEPPPYNPFNNQVIGGTIAVIVSLAVVAVALLFDTCWYGMFFITAAGIFSIIRGLVSGRNG